MAGLTKPKDRKHWCIVYYDEHGKLRRKSTGTTKRSLAVSIKAKWEEEQKRKKWGLGPEPPKEKADKFNPTLSEFWTLYREWMKSDYRKTTRETKTYMWSILTDGFFVENKDGEWVAPKRLGDVKPSDIEAHKARWRDAGRNTQTWNSFRKDMRSIWNHAKKLHLTKDGPVYLGPNPWTEVAPFPRRKAAKFAITPDQAQILMRAAQWHHALLAVEHPGFENGIDVVFALAYYAGLRKSEVIAAREEWIDWEQGTITVQAGWGFELKTENAYRSIPLSQSLRGILEPFKGQGGYLYLSGRENGAEANFRRSFGSVVALAATVDEGLKKVTPHILRHSFGSNLIISGEQMATVSRYMGHSSIAVTVDEYFHLTGHQDRGNFEKL